MNGTSTTCTTKASMFQSSYNDSFQNSRKEGCQAKKLAIARSLIGLLSVEVIAEKTGLDPETTAQLSST